MDSEAAAAEYRSLLPKYEEFSGRIAALVKQLCDGSAIEVQLIEKRAKSVESFRTKMTRPERRYLDPLHDITDLAGVRVVVFYEPDVNKVLDVLEREFTVDPARSLDKGSVLGPNEFEYRSVHYVVRLNEMRRALKEWADFADLVVEIQVRSLLQHAWAAISHKLHYKRNEEVPTQLQRALNRLSALFEVADDEFVRLRDKQKGIEDEIADKLKSGDLDVGINRLTMMLYLTGDATEDAVEKARRAGFVMLGDYSGHPLKVPETAHLIMLCNRAGIRTLAELEAILWRTVAWSPEFFSQLLLDARRRDGVARWGSDRQFVVSFLGAAECRARISEKDLADIGWHPDVAARVLRVANKLLGDTGATQPVQ